MVSGKVTILYLEQMMMGKRLILEQGGVKSIQHPAVSIQPADLNGLNANC
jgi:hypothetical protein